MLIKRNLYDEISKYLYDDEIIVIHGSRQVGKTSLMKYIQAEINDEDICLYIDLEDSQMLDLCNKGTENVIKYLKAKNYISKKKLFLFIDEIQYLDNPASFLKLFFDKYKTQIKLVVSGSSSFAIKSKFKDSLVGRILDFELFPLSFSEFLKFKEKKINTNIELPDVVHDELTELYKEFCIYGGYPAIVLENAVEKKEKKIKQIINTYIKADIRDLGGIRDINKFNNFLRILSSQCCGVLNNSEVAGNSGIAGKTAEDYIFILENTYIVKRIFPFFSRLNTELTKMPKLFFEDCGIQNILENNFFYEKVTGNTFENSVYTELRKFSKIETINFWRTKDHHELDFILKIKNKIIPVEVKLNSIKSFTSLNYFSEKYNNNNICIITLNKGKSLKNSKNIKCYAPWEIEKLIKDI